MFLTYKIQIIYLFSILEKNSIHEILDKEIWLINFWVDLLWILEINSFACLTFQMTIQKTSVKMFIFFWQTCHFEFWNKADLSLFMDMNYPVEFEDQNVVCVLWWLKLNLQVCAVTPTLTVDAVFVCQLFEFVFWFK